jgi:predicted DNA repair protein MutK
MLHLIAGPSVPASLVMPRGGGLWTNRFLLTSAITVLVALFLSVLWTLDDMGIRYFNRRDHELKMVGKYVGTVMPVLFGVYGVYGLMANYPAAEALLNIMRTVIILYPPFVLFAVLHTYVIKHNDAFLYTTNIVKSGEICHRG